jgi:hypothetical protein
MQSRAITTCLRLISTGGKWRKGQITIEPLSKLLKVHKKAGKPGMIVIMKTLKPGDSRN